MVRRRVGMDDLRFGTPPYPGVPRRPRLLSGWLPLPHLGD